MIAESYRVKTFAVEDSDARLRRTDDLNAFVTRPDGAIKTIPPGSSIRIEDVRPPSLVNILHLKVLH